MIKMQMAGLLIAAAGLACEVRGDIITSPWVTARLDLDWQEDPAFPHNDNGVLEPRERALMRMTVSFTGQGTLVTFIPNLGQFSSGTITGLGSCYVDIRGLAGDATGAYNGGLTVPPSASVGPNASNDGLSGYGVRGGWRWRESVANGQPVADGMVNIGPAQTPTDPSVANHTNPVANIERLGWQPASYAQRTQTFTVAGAAGTNNNVMGLYMDLDGGTTGGAAYVPTNRITFGSVNIPVVPSPAGLALLGLAASASGCRPVRKSLLLEESR